MNNIIQEDNKNITERGDCFSAVPHLQEFRENYNDWHVRSSEVDVLLPKSNSSSNIYESVSLYCRNTKICFNEHSFKQFCNLIKLSQMPDNLQNRTMSLVLRDTLESSEITMLFRLKQQADGTFLLRACLQKNYNRLDNIFILDGIKNACNEFNLIQTKYSYINEDELFLRLIRDGQYKKPLLKNVGDEYVEGVEIYNSEIGHNNMIKIKVVFVRLICTNGMTTNHSKSIQIPKTIIHAMTNYLDRLPPFPLPDKIQEAINNFIYDSIKGVFSNLEVESQYIISEAQRLDAIRLDDTGEQLSSVRIKEMIHTMIANSGMREIRGLSVSEIYEAYLQERKDFPDSENTAWLLYNAITRYANRVQKNDQRKSYLISSYSSRLLSQRLDWEKIKSGRKIRSQVKPSISPPIV